MVYILKKSYVNISPIIKIYTHTNLGLVCFMSIWTYNWFGPLNGPVWVCWYYTYSSIILLRWWVTWHNNVLLRRKSYLSQIYISITQISYMPNMLDAFSLSRARSSITNMLLMIGLQVGSYVNRWYNVFTNVFWFRD